jgi:hypothetical protein
MPETRPDTPTDASQSSLAEPVDLPLVGGALFKAFLRRTRSSRDALGWTSRRVVITVLLAWVPLLLLSMAGGKMWRGGEGLSFLQDVETQVRLLVAIPLLILAEITVHRQVPPIVRCFVESGLVVDATRARFDAAVATTKRLLNSVRAELLLIVLVYAVGMLVIRRTRFVLDVDSWYGSVVDGQLQLTYAGWWGALVSMPIVQFLVLRWYYRFFVWARFLWQVSRIPLNLRPTHPDRTAGLHFVASMERAYRPVLLAIGVVLAGTMANRILYAGATFAQFKVELIGTVVLLVLVTLGPMLVFTPTLIGVRHQGIRAYSRLGQRYAREFERKWLGGERPADEPLLGSADFQSLADLRSGFEVVKHIRAVPFDLWNVITLAVVTLIPVAPLVLTTASVEDILDRLLKTLF